MIKSERGSVYGESILVIFCNKVKSHTARRIRQHYRTRLENMSSGKGKRVQGQEA